MTSKKKFIDDFLKTHEIADVYNSQTYDIFKVKINLIKMFFNRGYYLSSADLSNIGYVRSQDGSIEKIPNHKYGIFDFIYDYKDELMSKTINKKFTLGNNYRKYYDNFDDVNQSKLFREFLGSEILNPPSKNSRENKIEFNKSYVYVVNTIESEVTWDYVTDKYFEFYEKNSREEIFEDKKYFTINALRFSPYQKDKKTKNINKDTYSKIEKTISPNINILNKINKTYIISNGINPGLNNNIKNHNNLQIFSFDQLYIDIVSHVLVPKHTILTKDERKQVFLVYGKKSLPTLLVSDPVARYYNAKIGDVFKITRNELTFTGPVPEYDFYRLVVPELISKK